MVPPSVPNPSSLTWDTTSNGAGTGLELLHLTSANDAIGQKLGSSVVLELVSPSTFVGSQLTAVRSVTFRCLEFQSVIFYQPQESVYPRLSQRVQLFQFFPYQQIVITSVCFFPPVDPCWLSRKDNKICHSPVTWIAHTGKPTTGEDKTLAAAALARSGSRNKSKMMFRSRPFSFFVCAFVKSEAEKPLTNLFGTGFKALVKQIISDVDDCTPALLLGAQMQSAFWIFSS